MKNKIKIDNLDIISFLNGMVFFSPVALLVRTTAGITVGQFFILQAILSLTIFLLEIPTGKLSDKLGYRNTLVLAEIMLCLARVSLFIAFLEKSLFLFVLEAVIEGIAACLSSGTQSAYIYAVFSEDDFVVKSAHVNNFGTIGFVVSTMSYSVIYFFSGLKGLLLATILTSAIAIPVSLGLKKEEPAVQGKNTAKSLEPKSNQTERKAIFQKICNRKTMLFIMLLSCINVAFILINFFYVDKLQACSVKEEVLTVIILGYSIVELLAEKILERVEEKRYVKMFVISFSIAGMGMILFGLTTYWPLVIGLMLVLPLLVDLPTYILDGLQNQYIDSVEAEDKRAELLSCFNMGVNLVEIVFLFSSSVIADLGMEVCFLALGGIMIVLGLIFGWCKKENSFFSKKENASFSKKNKTLSSDTEM